MSIRQLIINPGSTSTKISVYEDDVEVLGANITHTAEEISACGGLYEQVPMRIDKIRDFLDANDLTIKDFDCIMCRGGMVWGIGMGGYHVNEELAKTLADEKYTSAHASDLGGIIGKALADEVGIKAYIYDAVTGASLPEVARITGFPEIVRNSCCHVLNSHAVGLKHAKKLGVPFDSLNLIVAHLGGGISFSAFRNGIIIDSIGDDDGAFSPERSGFTQILPIVKMCYSGKYTEQDMKKKIRGQGGLVAYLGTADVRDVEKMIKEGNEKAKLLYQAQAYQVAKGIGELSVALKGTCDAIILTGGIAHSKMMTEMIKEQVEFIAPVEIYPGEAEMEALALGGLRIIREEEKAKEFKLKEIESNLELNI